MPEAAAPTQNPTALSAVFRRLASDASVDGVPPNATIEPGPSLQLHGFADPAPALVEPAAVAAPPLVEPFTPAEEDLEALAAIPRDIAPLYIVGDAFGKVERADRVEVEGDAEHKPEPGFTPAEPKPVAEPLSRAQALLGRLSGRPDDGPVARGAPPRPAEPAPKAVAPSAIATLDRSGRNALPRNRRLYRRAKLAAEMEIDGVPCTLIDLSVGGFAATGVPVFAANTIVPVSLRLTIDGIEVGTQLNARIVYAAESRSSGRFIDLTPSQTAFLRYVVTWRGESVGAVGTTTLLDAITGGPDRGFAPGSGDRSAPGPKERWWSGLIGRKVNPPR